MLRSALTAAIVLLGLALPATASGAFEYPGQTEPPEIVAEVAGLAQGYWDRIGVPAPQACANGLTTWVAPDLTGGDGVVAAGRGDGETCEIWLLQSYADELVRGNSFQDMAAACGVLVHEVGHARGLSHMPTGVMSIQTPPVPFLWTPGFCLSWARDAVMAWMRDAGSIPSWVRQITREIDSLLAPRRTYLARVRAIRLASAARR